MHRCTEVWGQHERQKNPKEWHLICCGWIGSAKSHAELLPKWNFDEFFFIVGALVPALWQRRLRYIISWVTWKSLVANPMLSSSVHHCCTMLASVHSCPSDAGRGPWQKQQPNIHPVDLKHCCSSAPCECSIPESHYVRMMQCSCWVAHGFLLRASECGLIHHL